MPLVQPSDHARIVLIARKAWRYVLLRPCMSCSSVYRLILHVLVRWPGIRRDYPIPGDREGVLWDCRRCGYRLAGRPTSTFSAGVSCTTELTMLAPDGTLCLGWQERELRGAPVPERRIDHTFERLRQMSRGKLPNAADQERVTPRRTLKKKIYCGISCEHV